MSKSSSAEWPFSFCDVVNCSRKRHLTSAVQLLSLLFLHLALFLSRLWKQKAQSKNTNFPSWKLNFAFLLSTENISRDFFGSMQFFMTVKQKAKNYQIDQFFLLFTHDHRKIEFKFLRQNRSKTFWLPILILVQFFKNHASSNSSIFGAKIQKMILFSGI